MNALRAILIPSALAALLTHAAGAAELSAKEMAAGKKLYTGKCARCHKFYDPAAYNDEQWQTWMEKMRRKSKLTDGQYATLSRYLDTFRAQGEPPKPATTN